MGDLQPTAPSLSSPQHLFINGSYTPSADTSTFRVINPLTGHHIYTSSSATPSDYLSAITAAHAAFTSWRLSTPSTRRRILLAAATNLETYHSSPVSPTPHNILSAEVSSTPTWTRTNLLGAAATLREAASLTTHIKGEIVPADRPGTTILIEREALGVCLAIAPWNAPVALAARAVAVPLACGNTVILKPSEFSVKSQHLVVQALVEAGLPPGVISYLPTEPSRAAELTALAIRDPRVRHVNFTGSDRVGRVIAGWAAEKLKRCVLELGGKAPVIILDDASVEDAVEAVVFGAFANAGQICMSTERVIVHSSIADEFGRELVERVRGLRVEGGAEEGVQVCGLYTPASAKRVQGLLRGAVDASAILLEGDLEVRGQNGTVMKPHVLDGVKAEMDVFRHESFGPLVCLTRFETDEEAIALANDSDFSLSSAVFSRDTLRAMDVARQVRAGSCHVNGPTVYMEPTLPNGGVGGSSGYGRFGGMAGVEEFTERKIITLSRPGMKHPF